MRTTLSWVCGAHWWVTPSTIPASQGWWWMLLRPKVEIFDKCIGHLWFQKENPIYVYRWALPLNFLWIFLFLPIFSFHKSRFYHAQLLTESAWMFFVGMLGSCQDLTVIRKSPLWAKLVDIRANEYFNLGQYILGDLGYMNVPHMVSSFKRTDSNVDKEAFNMCMAKCHVTNEHCIGVLKSRWHSLKKLGPNWRRRMIVSGLFDGSTCVLFSTTMSWIWMIIGRIRTRP